jgi:teichuronic acid biosynthesis glycosyltransferase TuaC
MGVSAGPVCSSDKPLGAGRTRVLNVLTLTTVFPNSNEPGQGAFIYDRMRHVARLANVKVLALSPLVDYSNPNRDWFASRRIQRTAMDDRFEVLRPRWLFPPFGTPLNPLCMYARLIGLLRRLRVSYPFDILDAHFGYPEGVAAVLLAHTLGIPMMVTLRGNEPIFARSSSRRATIQWALRRADRVVSVSEELRQYAVSLGVDPARTAVVPNGIDGERFFPHPPNRARFGIRPGAWAIVSVGRLVKKKGHQYAIRALAQLRARGVDAQLAIAGGPCRESHFEEPIRKLIRELGLEDHVILLGQVSSADISELLSSADVFCLASDSEGWPNALHEAQACGCPVVATAVGAVPDMIPGPEFGYIVPAQDADALAAAFEKASARSWDRNRIAEWGRSRSWTKVADEVLDNLWEAVAARHPGV